MFPALVDSRKHDQHDTKLGLKSTFGKQSYSNRVSAPLFSFSRSSYHAQSKTFIGHEFVQRDTSPSPGPAVYYPPLPPQKKVVANLNWHASKTDRQPFLSLDQQKGVPGPGMYQHADAQAMVRQSTGGTLKFSGMSAPTDQRRVFISHKHAAREWQGICSPGPNLGREHARSFGPQPDSRKQTSPGWSICKRERFHAKRGPSAVPGPGSYNY